MAQWVKYLLLKYEGLSSDPQQPDKNLGMVVHSYNPSIGGTETEESLGLGDQVVLQN